MRELGLEPCQPRPWRVSLTEGDGQEHDIPDLVAQCRGLWLFDRLWVVPVFGYCG
jgi:hypothetical protein